VEKLYQAQYASPIGIVEITATDQAIVSVVFTESIELVNEGFLPLCLQNGLQQLAEYFAGHRQTFDLPVASSGTVFQEQVWRQLQQIRFGRTLSYYDLSFQLGNIGAIRAVGSANGKNQLLLIRPCHRVIGADGKLVGYAGGLWRKKWLLEHERKVVGTSQLTLFG